MEENVSLSEQASNWTVLNTSISSDVDMLIFEHYRKNRKITETAFIILVLCYACLILAGSIGNILVICAVIRNPKMRTSRNFYILNLAISDLFLCLFTMPFTLLEIVTRYWVFGKFMCKFVGSMQAVSIFISTMNITAIALDRYKVILYPVKTYDRALGSVAILIAIWIISAVLSSPLIFFRTTNSHELSIGSLIWKLEFCLENWPIEHGRAFYSLFSISFQYVLPILIVSVVYGKIGKRLKKRAEENLTLHSEAKRKEETERVKRTNLLFISIGLVFGICWLPLNIYNLILDFGGDLHLTQDTNVTYVTFAVCHMLGMSSACLNPFFYGWLNNNFHDEFVRMGLFCKNNFLLGILKICGSKKKSNTNTKIPTLKTVEIITKATQITTV